MPAAGDDHPISIRAVDRRMQVEAAGRTIIDAQIVLELREEGYKPVCYAPRDNASMSLLERSDHTTFCPYKGEATYYHVKTPDGRIENAVWSYEDPYPGVAAIRGHLAVFPDKVSLTLR